MSCKMRQYHDLKEIRSWLNERHTVTKPERKSWLKAWQDCDYKSDMIVPKGDTRQWLKEKQDRDLKKGKTVTKIEKRPD